MRQPKMHRQSIRRLSVVAKKLDMPMTKLLNLIVTTALEELEPLEVDDAIGYVPVRPEEPQREPQHAHTLPHKRRRWLRALAIAKTLFEEQGCHTTYLDEIEEFLTAARDSVEPANPTLAGPSAAEEGAIPPPSARACDLEGLLGDCVFALEVLLTSPDLTLDSLEQATRDAIAVARETLDAVHAALSRGR